MQELGNIREGKCGNHVAWMYKKQKNGKLQKQDIRREI